MSTQRAAQPLPRYQSASAPPPPPGAPLLPTIRDLSKLNVSLPGRLALRALEHPDRLALREKRLGLWQEMSWRHYWEEVQAVGHKLHAMGIQPGDHVSILSGNRTEWVFADLGIQGIGARSVGVYQTNTAEDVEYVVTHSQSRVIFCEDQEQVDKLVEIGDRVPLLEAIVVFDMRGLRHYDEPRLMSWADFIVEGRRLAQASPGWFSEQVAGLDPDAGAMVVYTSGTTGQPKGAVLSSRNVTSPADHMGPALGFDLAKPDLILSYLPLCHVAEKIFTLFLPLSFGAVVHFGESIDTVQQDLREVSPTIFLGVPRIWEKMHAGVEIKMRDSSWLKRTLFRWTEGVGQRALGREGGPSVADRIWGAVGDLLILRPLQERLGLRRCRIPVSGAAPISAELLRWYHGMGVPILEGYGQTECAGVSHVQPPGAPKIGSVGQALGAFECKIAEDGEILVRGAPVFVGYLHNEEATRETIDEEGWLHTGDIGVIDPKGYLAITGRKKEIIITAGGKNLSPERIENALKMSPYVKEAVAIGDKRKFVSALVQIELDTVGDWATRQKIPYTSYEDLCSKPQVVDLIQEAITEANEHLARVESVRGFRLLPKQLNQDDGELTATQKVRRKAVVAKFEALIEEMYGRG